MVEVPQVRVENRKGPDLILRLIDFSRVLLWGLLLVNFGIIMSAKPEGETFFDRLFNISVRNYWDYKLLQIATILLLVQFVASVISLYLNSKRLKRKGDRIRVSIIISLFASLILCIILILVLYV